MVHPYVGCVRILLYLVLLGGGGGLVCGLVEEVDFLSANFDSKQSRNTLDLLSACYISLEV